MTPPDDTATPPDDTATPPDDTATPPDDTATPADDPVTPSDDTETPAEGAASQEEQRPVLRVVTPDTTPEEVAALVAVFAALGSGEAPPRKRPSEWSAAHRKLRRTLPHGPGGWRSSGLPT